MLRCRLSYVFIGVLDKQLPAGLLAYITALPSGFQSLTSWWVTIIACGNAPETKFLHNDWIEAVA